MKKKKLAIITLGCQMNRHDAEWIRGLLAEEYGYTESQEEADLLIVTTCSVREKAEQKFFSLLGRLRPLKKNKPELIIAAAGCIAQERGAKIIKREPLVDIVFGTRAIDKLPLLLQRFERSGVPQVDISDSSVYDEYPMERHSTISAWVSIMRGCDNQCSYCIVPQTRGPEQSRPADSIIAELQKLGEAGYQEVTLLGQNVNSYGVGQKPSINFPMLLRRIATESPLPRIRFVTSHPKDLSDDLVEVMATIPHLCPSLHLPLQSGNDAILALMKRGYSAEHYFSRIAALRKAIPDISLTSDIIVGFPTESHEHFMDTYRGVERAQFDNIYLFKYSPRPGTSATELGEVAPPDELSHRFSLILELQKKISQKRFARWQGREVEVLVDRPSAKGDRLYTGRTGGNHPVTFASPHDVTGKFVHVTIQATRQLGLVGRLSGEPSALVGQDESGT